MHACPITQLCPTLCNPMDCSPLFMEFHRQEYWSGLPFPPPGDRPNPGMEPRSSASASLAGRFFTTEPPGKPQFDNKPEIKRNIKFPGGSDSKESVCNAGDLGFNPWFGKMPWRREWQPTPIFLPGEFHGQRSLVGYSPRDRRVRHN